MLPGRPLVLDREPADAPDDRAAVARFSDRQVVWGIALVVVALAVPFALRGPGLIIDDWRFLSYREFDGVLGTGGWSKLLRRPGCWAVYTATFGVLGPRPLALFAVQTALNAAVAVSLFTVGRRFFSRHLAIAVAVVWALLPNTSALDYWASVLNGVVAVLLLVLGIGKLDDDRWRWALGLLTASALCYEVTLPAAAAAVVVVPWYRGRLRWRPTVVSLAVLVVVGLWMMAHPTYPVDRPLVDPTPAWGAHFGAGITSSPTMAKVLGLAVAVAVALAAWRALRRRASEADRLVLVGLGVFAVGLVAVLKFDFDTVGIGDRAYAVSSIGAATVLVGAGAALWRHRRPFGVGATVLVAAFVVPANFERQAAYDQAGEDMVDLLDHIDQRYGDEVPPYVIVGPAHVRHDGVPPTVGLLHARGALRLHRGDPDLQLEVADSSEQFYAQPHSARINWADIREESADP